MCSLYLQIGQMELGHQLGVKGGMLEGHLVKGKILFSSTNALDIFLIPFFALYGQQ